MQSEAVNNHQQMVGSVKPESENATHVVEATVESKENDDVISSKVQTSMEDEDIVKTHAEDKIDMSPKNDPRVKAGTSTGATMSKKYQRLSEEARLFVWSNTNPRPDRSHQKKLKDEDLSTEASRFSWYNPETPEIHSLADCSAEQKAFLAYNVKAYLTKLLKAFKAIFHQELKWSTISLLKEVIEKDPEFTKLASVAERYYWYAAFDLAVKPRGGHTTGENAEGKPIFTDEQRAYIGYFVGFVNSFAQVADSFYDRFGGGRYDKFDIKREAATLRHNRTRRLYYVNIAESRGEWDWYQGPMQPGDPNFLMQERLARQDKARERKAGSKQACDLEERSEELSSGEGIEPELYNTSGEGPEELIGS
ncbi:hypothetical protein G7Y79_00009g027440 [Physcia stellaris]|nr:hypothetical protein G7Y79_00009g027440 [Physcia stellaris]